MRGGEETAVASSDTTGDADIPVGNTYELEIECTDETELGDVTITVTGKSNQTIQLNKSNCIVHGISAGDKVTLETTASDFCNWYVRTRYVSWNDLPAHESEYSTTASFEMPDKDLTIRHSSHKSDKSGKLYISVMGSRRSYNYVSSKTVRELKQEILNDTDIKESLAQEGFRDDNTAIIRGEYYWPDEQYLGQVDQSRTSLSPDDLRFAKKDKTITVIGGKASPIRYEMGAIDYNNIVGETTYVAGQNIYLYAEPRIGQTFKKWTVTTANTTIDDKYNQKWPGIFDIPENVDSVTVTAEYEQDNLYVGNVLLPMGKYLASGENEVSDTCPGNSYAHLSEDGKVLTLHNYNNNGKTKEVSVGNVNGIRAAIVLTAEALRIKLEGSNTLSGDYGFAPPNYKADSNITFEGVGKLVVYANKEHFYLDPGLITRKISEDQYQTTTKPDTTQTGSYYEVGLKSVPIPDKDTSEYTYNGIPQTYKIKDLPAYTIEDNKQTDAGTYTVTVKLNDKNRSHWKDGVNANDTSDKTYEFTIKPKQLSGDPEVSTVTESGKTLKNVTLTAPSDWPAGDFSWNDDDETEVTLETSYGWTFTPKDTDNYIGTKGNVIPWKKVLQPEVKADTHVHEYQWEYDYADSETDDIVAYNRCKYCGDTKESHTIPNSAYYNWNLGVAKKIAAAKQNAVVTIDTTKWTTFHEMVLYALEKRPDVALRVRYTVVGGKDNGKRRQLLIPAVSAEDTVASAKREGIKDRFVNKFCGFGNLADFEEEYQYGNKK